MEIYTMQQKMTSIEISYKNKINIRYKMLTQLMLDIH